MTPYSPPARATDSRDPRLVLVSLAVALAAIVATLVYQSVSMSVTPSLGDLLRGDQQSATAKADGALPNGATVFDDKYPGVANLDAELLRALRAAATDAANDGVKFFVNSGWRSPEYQSQLLREAVLKYGSEAEAARWVATPEASLHVSGDAVDIGPFYARAWLSEHGAGYGLCQIYDNEPWHFELRPDAIENGCPPKYADPTQDPRTQR